MGEHKSPRTLVDQDPEVFKVFEPETGQIFPMRELTNEQLEKHIKAANEQSMVLMRQAMTLIGESRTASKVASCMEYERDRRRRTIQIASPLDISGLRRQ